MRSEIVKYGRIRNLITDKDLTQSEVATLLNVKQNTYSQYKIGMANYPIDTLITLVEFYQSWS